MKDALRSRSRPREQGTPLSCDQSSVATVPLPNPTMGDKTRACPGSEDCRRLGAPPRDEGITPPGCLSATWNPKHPPGRAAGQGRAQRARSRTRGWRADLLWFAAPRSWEGPPRAIGACWCCSTQRPAPDTPLMSPFGTGPVRPGPAGDGGASAAVYINAAFESLTGYPSLGRLVSARRCPTSPPPPPLSSPPSCCSAGPRPHRRRRARAAGSAWGACTNRQLRPRATRPGSGPEVVDRQLAARLGQISRCLLGVCADSDERDVVLGAAGQQ